MASLSEAESAAARSRSRAEIEADLLAAAAQEHTVRSAVLKMLLPPDFSLPLHRALLGALADIHETAEPEGVDAALARRLGLREGDITAWRLAASPSTPFDDLDLLVALR